MAPLLSICIPTYNRSQLLKTTLESIVSDPVFQDTGKVEIVISDNCSTDDTPDVCKPFVESFPEKVRYNRLESPITGDENFIVVLNAGRGKYLKLNNDRVHFRDNALTAIVSLLEKQDVGNVLFFLNKNNCTDETPKVASFLGFDEFMKNVSYLATWIGGLCVRSEMYRKIEKPEQYSHLQFGQIFIISELLRNSEKSSVLYNHYLIDKVPDNYHRDFNVIEGFNKLMRIIVNHGYLQEKTYQKTIKEYLPVLNCVFRSEVRWTKQNFRNYFHYFYPVYGKHLYFYIELLKMFIKAFVERYFCKIEDNEVKLVLFGHTICSRPNVKIE